MSMKEPSYYNHSQLIDPFIKASGSALTDGRVFKHDCKGSYRKGRKQKIFREAEDGHRVTKGGKCTMS